MRGLTAYSIVEQSPPLSTEAKRLDCPAEGAVQRLNAYGCAWNVSHAAGRPVE
jgi:hypothetical protein